jgi:hypothetical protein
VTDIVERLLDPDDMDEYHDVRREASIEIKRLRVHNIELRGNIEALRAKILRDTAEIARLMVAQEKLRQQLRAELAEADAAIADLRRWKGLDK